MNSVFAELLSPAQEGLFDAFKQKKAPSPSYPQGEEHKAKLAEGRERLADVAKVIGPHIKKIITITRGIYKKSTMGKAYENILYDPDELYFTNVYDTDTRSYVYTYSYHIASADPYKIYPDFRARMTNEGGVPEFEKVWNEIANAVRAYLEKNHLSNLAKVSPDGGDWDGYLMSVDISYELAKKYIFK